MDGEIGLCMGQFIHLKDAHLWFPELSELGNLRKKMCPLSGKCYGIKYGLIIIFQASK
jgi:hypothetical protein